MPSCNVNCCLCGAPVSETQPWPEWMSCFRAVCIVDKQWTSAFVSGVGERQRFADLVPNPFRDGHGITGSKEGVTLSTEPSEDSEQETMDIDIYSSQAVGLRADGPGHWIWGFPFHCSCWKLLKAHRETQGAANHEPQIIFDVLRSFPRHRLIEFGHDYGGVAGYDIEPDVFDIGNPSHQLCYLLPGEEPRLVYDRTDPALLEMQKHDPMRVAEVCAAFKGGKPTDRPVSEARSAEPQHKDTTTSSDPFGKLPIELLQFILSELSSPEVVTLKQSSPVFNRLPLPDTFWRSRFLPGREFEHVFEALKYSKTRNGDWKAIYQHLRNVRKSPALVNRRRIWNLARILDYLVETKLESQICLGTTFHSYFESAPTEDMDTAWIEAHRCLRPYNQAFHTGCRELYVRTLLVPPNATNIYVSLVEILGKVYVCGLRLKESRGTSQKMGYVRPGNEIMLIWNIQAETREPTGFHLALDQHGIRGLCIVSGANELSGWAGQNEGIPKRRLVASADTQDEIIKLKGGFDALKLVSLSLLTHNGTSSRSSAPTTPSLRDMALWSPNIPEPDLSFSGITMQELRLDDLGEHQRPLSMLIFGTRHVAGLNRIERLTVLTQEDHGVMGLEVAFEYPIDGKSSVFIGSSKPCVPLNMRPPPETLLESNMLFDISAGEELVALDVLQGYYVVCFKVYTNLGRVFELPPPDDSEWDMETRAEDLGKIISVKPGSGKVIGFLARAGSKGLQNLGLVHTELPEKLPLRI